MDWHNLPEHDREHKIPTYPISALKSTIASTDQQLHRPSSGEIRLAIVKYNSEVAEISDLATISSGVNLIVERLGQDVDSTTYARVLPNDAHNVTGMDFSRQAPLPPPAFDNDPETWPAICNPLPSALPKTAFVYEGLTLDDICGWINDLKEFETHPKLPDSDGPSFRFGEEDSREKIMGVCMACGK